MCLRKALLCSFNIVWLSACTVGPDYVRPAAIVPEHFKALADWKMAQPQDNALPTEWWHLFRDSQLNHLEVQVALANQSLRQAEAQYRQAQSVVQAAQAPLLPKITLNTTFNRFLAASGQSVAVAGVRNLFGSAIAAAWEPDIWGSVRRQIEASTDTAQASAATLHALRLSLQAMVAQYYFELKTLDAQKSLLEETVRAYRKVLVITENRYAAGIIARSEVKQAQAQLSALQAQALNLGIQRSKLEHAIAVLLGKPPANLTISADIVAIELPAIPVSVPSTLLERRPDVAAAERQMAAANAQIGVAKAAFYPSVSLAASNGYQSNTLEALFTAARRYWALGPAGLALTLLDGGAKHAQYKQAIANFDASVAAYRQTVLTSFQEVEDSLMAIRILTEEANVQEEAVKAADEALQLTLNQYQAGTVSYLNVLTAHTAALNNRQTLVQLQGQQLSTSVLLIKALGGGWNSKQLPTATQAAGTLRWRDYLALPLDY